MNKWAYKMSAPRRRDILVYERDGVSYITRVIGLPGEQVEIKQGSVYIDGRFYEESGTYPGDFSMERTVLGENEYFVLEDNRQEADGKNHIIRKSDITGKVMVTH